MKFKIKPSKIFLTVFLFSALAAPADETGGKKEKLSSKNTLSQEEKQPVEKRPVEKLPVENIFSEQGAGTVQLVPIAIHPQPVNEALKKVNPSILAENVIDNWAAFIKKAQKGDAQAQEIVTIILEAVGGESSPESQLNIALQFLQIEDPKLYIKWLRRAAEEKVRAALYLLAEEYTSGKWIEKNERRAVELLKEASRLDLAQASYELGKRHLLGEFGENSDPKKAVFYLQKAASESFGPAQELFANILIIGFSYDYKAKEHKQFIKEFLSQSTRELLIIQWYRRAAEQGSPTAQMALGLLLIVGHTDFNIPKNEKEGLKFLMKAGAQSKNMEIKIEALFHLSDIYHYGIEGKVDSNSTIAMLFYKEMDLYPDETRKYLNEDQLEDLKKRRKAIKSLAFKRQMQEIIHVCRRFFSD